MVSKNKLLKRQMALPVFTVLAMFTPHVLLWINCDIFMAEATVARMPRGQLVQECACDVHWARGVGAELVPDDLFVELDIDEHHG